jgi:predicted tellurium resistance membrane protein TerC
MDWIASPEAWISLLTLTTLEIVLGIDNIVFIAILADRLPQDSRAKARRVGLTLAVGMRVLLLTSIVWIMSLTQPLFSALGREISGRDLILVIGGIFLLAKATREIHHKLEGEEESRTAAVHVSFSPVIVQIMLLDIVFSLDSVITAVGMANEVGVMIAAVVIAIGVMLVAARSISDFVNRHPTLKILALSFLILIGVTLVGEGLGRHIPKGYIYFSMAFAFGVEMLNLKLRSKERKQQPVALHQPYR